jgi:hypothetical protein
MPQAQAMARARVLRPAEPRLVLRSLERSAPTAPNVVFQCAKAWHKNWFKATHMQQLVRVMWE